MIKKNTAFILLFILAVWLLAPAFDTIDDSFMVQVVSGKYGHHPSDLMLYSSPIYGKVLVLLYQFIPSFNWYYFIFLLAHMVSWLVILDIFLKYEAGHQRFAMIMFLLLFATFGLYFLGTLQFTTTAFILALSGLLLIMNKKNNAAIIGGIMMLFLASMIRLYGVWLLICLALPWFIYKWILSDGLFNILKHKKTILIMAGLVITTFVLRETGKAIYRHTESGKTLRSFLFHRGELIDNPNFVNTPANWDTFKKANWTGEDFKMFFDYYFDPLPPFTGENLKEIHDHLNIIKPDQSRLFNGFKKLFSQYQFYALLLLLIISGALFKKISKKNLLFFILQSGSILLFLLYILFFNDFKSRVIIPLFFISSLFIAMHILREAGSGQYALRKLLPYIKVSIVIFIAIAIYFNYAATRERRNNDRELKKQIAFINDIEKDWLVVHGYDLPIEHATLRLINNGVDLKGKVFFTMPSYLMHYLTGSKRHEKHQSVFDLLCSEQQTILLLHNDKTTTISELLNYSGSRAKCKIPGYARIENPGVEYNLYLLKQQDTK